MSDLALKISSLEKKYASGVKALDGIDLEVKKGDFFALLGPNGAGKSSTIGIISSLVTKTSGSVKIFDIDIDEDFNEAKRKLGVVAQEINFSPFEKVEDIVITQAGYYGISASQAKPKTETTLKRLGLWEKRSEQARNLSGGLKRRLMIAKALIHDPELLILDEPTAGVDIELRRSMWDFLTEMNESGTSIILTTHYLEEAEMLCRQIAIIDRGVIKEDTSMKSFLNQLNEESFIFDLAEPIGPLQLNIIGVKFNLIDSNTLEVTMDRAHTLNDLFQLLESQAIRVRSMRNKSNRLEELFVRMVEKNLEGEAK